MPAVSKKQQRFMGAVRAAQKGATPISGKVASVAKEMEPSDVKKFAATKHKGLPNKVKKEAFENTIGEIYAVRKPFEECDQASMVQKVDPLQGIMAGGQYTPEMFHGIYNDEKQAQSVAETLYNEYFKGLQALEEKKEMTGNKIKKAIDKLEKERKKHVEMAKENPAEASKCRQHIANITTKIDDLMTKMERIEKSKKQLEKAEDKEEKKKENLKESESKSITLVDKLTATPKGGGDNITIAKGEKVTAGKRFDKEPNVMSITYKGKQYTVTAGPFINKYLHNKKDKK